MYAGISVKAVTIRTLILSGAICGVIGVLLSASINHTVSTALHKNMGFTAIMTSWLAGFNPIATIGTSFLIVFINTGMGEVRQNFGFTNDSIGNVALGLIYFFIIACQFFVNYKVIFRNHKTTMEEVGVITRGGEATATKKSFFDIVKKGGDKQ